MAPILHRIAPCYWTNDADLHLLADGERIEPAYQAADAFLFRINKPFRVLRLASKTARPARFYQNQDVRQLGYAVSAIRLVSTDGFKDLSCPLKILTEGFHELENGFRWTTGSGKVPGEFVTAMPMPFLLVVRGFGLSCYQSAADAALTTDWLRQPGLDKLATAGRNL